MKLVRKNFWVALSSSVSKCKRYIQSVSCSIQQACLSQMEQNFQSLRTLVARVRTHCDPSKAERHEDWLVTLAGKECVGWWCHTGQSWFNNILLHQHIKEYKKSSLKCRECSSLLPAGILFLALCAEWDLFESRLGENSRNSFRRVKTDSERLEKSQPKPGQELRSESLEKRKNDERTHGTWEIWDTYGDKYRKSIEGKKGIAHTLSLWLTGQVTGKKIPINIYD